MIRGLVLSRLSQGLFEFKVAAANSAGAGVASKGSKPYLVGGQPPKWSLGEAGNDHFGFYTVFDEGKQPEGYADGERVPVGFFHWRDGEVWSAASSGYMASHAKSEESLAESFPSKYPIKVVGEAVRCGFWDLSEDGTNNLVFSRDGLPKVALTTRGEIWSAQSEGFLMSTNALQQVHLFT